MVYGNNKLDWKYCNSERRSHNCAHIQQVNLTRGQKFVCFENDWPNTECPLYCIHSLTSNIYLLVKPIEVDNWSHKKHFSHLWQTCETDNINFGKTNTIFQQLNISKHVQIISAFERYDKTDKSKNRLVRALCNLGKMLL